MNNLGSNLYSAADGAYEENMRNRILDFELQGSFVMEGNQSRLAALPKEKGHTKERKGTQCVPGLFSRGTRLKI